MSDTHSDRLGRSIASYDRYARDFRERRKNREGIEDLADAFAAALDDGALVADLGCGPGYDAPRLRERGLSVISMDLSLGMLALARDESPGRCVRADLRHLPVRVGALDGIWSMASLVHLGHAEVELALRGYRASLRDGGALMVAVKHVRGEAGREPVGDEDARSAAGRTTWCRGRDGPDDVRWFSFWDEAAFDDTLARTGFRFLGGSTDDAWLKRLAVAV